MKKCAKCGIEKKLNEFYETKRINGYTARCKLCHGISDRKCVVCGGVFSGLISKKLCSAKCRKIYRPKTHKKCNRCNSVFIVDRLSRKYCSQKCKIEAQTTGRKKKYITTKKARSAQRKVAYAIETGRLIRPDRCEKCEKQSKIEAAHSNYNNPLQVRWLCRSCHVKRDKMKPKDAGYSVTI